MTSLLLGSLLHRVKMLVVAMAWMQCFQASDSFLQSNIHHHNHCIKQSRVLLPSSSSPSQERSLRSVFVTDDVSFMGAATALSAYEVLTGQVKIPTTRELKRVAPPAQPVHRMEQFDQYCGQATTASRSEGSILHVSVDPTGHQLSRETVEHISHVGFYLSTGSAEGGLNPETAHVHGTVLQQALHTLPPGAQAFIAVDAPLHVAMLHANCLPRKSFSSPSPHNDSYLVMMPNGDSILMDYLFTEAPGGQDPLCCPTKEMLVETSPTDPSLSRSTAQSAAYTAMRGNGLDPLRSAAVAASVATVLGDDHFANQPLSWDNVKRVVQLTKHIHQFGCKEMPGIMTRTYKEYGYK